MHKRHSPRKGGDHFGGNLDDVKKRHVRMAVGHILNDYRADFEKGLKVVVTPKTLLPYLKAESEIYEYLKKADMDTNTPGFMKSIQNYIVTVMKNKDMIQDLMESNRARADLCEVSEDNESSSEQDILDVAKHEQGAEKISAEPHE